MSNINEFENHFNDLVNNFLNEIFNEFSSEQEDNEIEFEQEQELDLKDTQTNAKVFLVPPNHLPKGKFWRALGIYVPYSHEIYIANNLPKHIEKFVYYHEVAHSLGIMDEEQADRFATKKCGYYVNLREPRGYIMRY